jgi:hypothetical protein
MEFLVVTKMISGKDTIENEDNDKRYYITEYINTNLGTGDAPLPQAGCREVILRDLEAGMHN